MWSQPNIVRMNAEAKAKAPDYREAERLGFMPTFKQRIEATQLTFDGGVEPNLAYFFDTHPEYRDQPYAYADGILTVGEELECECAGWGQTDCSGKKHQWLWYDIFSDDPKGILTLCERHDGYFGSPTEGYFTCGDCGEVFINNYTWELYHTEVEGELVCLPCAAKAYIRETENWIPLTAKDIKLVDFEVARQAQHVIGVDMPVPDSVKFFDNAEFDSMDGHQISGSRLQEILRRAKTEGYTKALLILDAAYQFAVSIGVYVDSTEAKALETKAARRAARSRKAA